MTIHLDERLQQKLALIQTDKLSLVGLAFLLGTRIAEQANSEEKLTEVLVSVAKGELSLQPSGAEVRSQHPDAKDTEQIRADNQDTDRIMAHLVVQWFHQRM